MFNDIKSNYILKKIIRDNLDKKIYLSIAKYNKKLQNKIGLNLENYKEYSNRMFNRTEIELIPYSHLKPDIKYYFIRRKENRAYYHIYFDEDKKEINRTYITNADNVKKIYIKIDMELKSLKGLFYKCEALKEVKFTKFNREDFTDLCETFNECIYLDKLDVTKFKTSKVTKMNWMFTRCESLQELNILNFDTSNVTEMMCLFSGCKRLKELNFKFNTKNVINMRNMFFECRSLKKIDISNFDTSSLKCFSEMFYNCISLDKLDNNIVNFFNLHFADYSRMFGGCNETLKAYIRKTCAIKEDSNNSDNGIFDTRFY